MKQFNTLILFFAIVLGFLFNSCKKYPEDERRFLLRPEGRMPLNSVVKEILYNNYDSTMAPTYKIARQYIYRFTQDKKHGGVLDAVEYHAEWEFDQKKNNIKFTNFRWDSALAFSSILPRGNSTWEIRKLTKKELKLRSYINGNKYEITFHRY